MKFMSCLSYVLVGVSLGAISVDALRLRTAPSAFDDADADSLTSVELEREQQALVNFAEFEMSKQGLGQGSEAIPGLAYPEYGPESFGAPGEIPLNPWVTQRNFRPLDNLRPVAPLDRVDR